jgi:leucyl-tRNA synthetase
MYPIAPHICYSVLSEFDDEDASNPTWPEKFNVSNYDEEIQIIIQINGKLRSRLNVKLGIGEEQVISLAEKDNKILELIKDKNVIKKIYVPNKLINFVIK